MITYKLKQTPKTQQFVTKVQQGYTQLMTQSPLYEGACVYYIHNEHLYVFQYLRVLFFHAPRWFMGFVLKNKLRKRKLIQHFIRINKAELMEIISKKWDKKK